MAYQLAGGLQLAEDQVASGITKGLFDAHSGVAFLDEDDAPKLLHLGWHKRVFVQPLTDCANWLVRPIPLPEELAPQLTGLLCASAKRYGDNANAELSFGYGLNVLVGPDSIGWDGAYAPTERCDGYTCSSFVAAVFEKVGFKLVDMQSWPRRDEDKVWGEAIVCMLRASGAGDVHAAKVLANVNGLRLRPEELAAAAEVAKHGRPAHFRKIKSRSKALLLQVRAQCGLRSAPPAFLAACFDGYKSGLEALAVAKLQMRLAARRKRYTYRPRKRRALHRKVSR